MKWTRGSRSDDVEDRRGVRVSRGVALGGGGVIVAIIVVVVGRLLGVDLSGVVGGGESSSPPAEEPAPQSGKGAQSGSAASGKLDPKTDPDHELVEFVTFVINDVQDSFARLIEAQHPYDVAAYRRAKLVIFTEAVNTGCGQSSAAIGPFYCPPDEKAYIDLSFYRELKQRFGAPGDFAQAYVLAHELGHHLQTLFGIDADVTRKSTKKNRNALSVRMELQADCFAGVWASAARDRNLLELGDAQEAIDAATAIGDDRLAKMAGAPDNPETWTHGSSSMRVRWFTKGFESGTFAGCDTFSAGSL